MVSDWVIVTVPYEPASTTSISPPAAVCASAPANVAHGVARLLHVFESAPVDATQVRADCPCTMAVPRNRTNAAKTNFFIAVLLSFRVVYGRADGAGVMENVRAMARIGNVSGPDHDSSTTDRVIGHACVVVTQMAVPNAEETAVSGGYSIIASDYIGVIDC